MTSRSLTPKDRVKPEKVEVPSVLIRGAFAFSSGNNATTSSLATQATD